MTGNAAARAAIEARVAALEATWNEHDAVAFTEGFAEDVDFTNVFGITLRGRAAITASHAAIFKGMFSASTLAITETCIRFIHDDIAAIDARWEMTGARDPMGRRACGWHLAVRGVSQPGPDAAGEGGGDRQGIRSGARLALHRKARAARRYILVPRKAVLCVHLMEPGSP